MHALNGKNFGKYLFRFVVIADTHCNQEEGKSASPYAVNALANARARYVIHEVNRLAPEFVLHLGDIVHPVPELPSFVPAVDQFKSIVKGLKPKLYLIPGNHDVGDKPVAWMPAGTVTSEFVDHYRKLFGDDFYSFDANECHFVMINAQIINSGLPREEEQRKWLEADFECNARKRIFIGIHYPPYVSERNEPSSYDNIDEPGRSWLLALIERYKPEAMFCGHVHNFWYDLIGSTECYLLPSTAFVRQDYSELYHVGPGKEQGRNEEEKLGYFVVEVYEKGHVAHFVRTFGIEQKVGAQNHDLDRLPPVHTKTNFVAPVGVDLRHPWQEILEVAATGGVQEFERKKIRNDYPLLAMWEMGVRKLRIPLHDLLNSKLRRRIRILRALGHEFILHHFGLPDATVRNQLIEFRDLISALEIVVPIANIAALEEPLSELRRLGGFAVYLSKLRKHEDAQYDGSHFNHFVNHGFVPAEHVQLKTLFDRPQLRAAADGVIMRIVRKRSPWNDVPTAFDCTNELGIKLAFQVRLAGDNPAELQTDDLDTANRVAETIVVGFAHPDSDIVFDTFDDIDRGYFSRNGLVDRRSNPNPAGWVYRNLHSALKDMPKLKLGQRKNSTVGTVCYFEAGSRRCALILPATESTSAASLYDEDGEGRWIDLVTGIQGRSLDGIKGNPVLWLK